MRTKLALALASASAIAILAPIAPAEAGLFRHTAKDACCVRTATAPVYTRGYMARMAILNQPMVIAPTTCGAAILTDAPSDLDMRREQLSCRINELAAVGLIGCDRAAYLNSAMLTVGQGEIAMRGVGPCGALSDCQARKLYRAMDKVASELNRSNSSNAVDVAGLGLFSGTNWY